MELIPQAIATYQRLATGQTEKGLVVCYGSMYGNTASMAEAVCEGAAEAGMKKIVVQKTVPLFSFEPPGKSVPLLPSVCNHDPSYLSM